MHGEKTISTHTKLIPSPPTLLSRHLLVPPHKFPLCKKDPEMTYSTLYKMRLPRWITPESQESSLFPYP